MKKQFRKLELRKKSISDLNIMNTIVGGDERTDLPLCETHPFHCPPAQTEIGCPKPPVLKSINQPTC